MLYLVGIGLHPKHLTLEAIEAIERCEKIYAELYTSEYPIEELKKEIGREIEVLSREQVEERFEEVLSIAEEKDIALLVPGSPFVATTHISLVLQAERRGVEVRSVEGISIQQAIGKIGLIPTRFGKVCSIPKWSEDYKPKSFYKEIVENKRRKLHTLALLDIGLSVDRAISRLLEIEREEKERAIGEGEKIVGIARLFWEDELIIYAKARELMEIKWGIGPQCLIIPAELHFVEEEALRRWEKREGGKG